MPRSCDTSHLEIDRLLPSVHPLHPAVVAATTGEKKKHLQSGALLLPPAHHHFAFPSFSHLLSLVSSRSSNSFLLSPTYAFWICRTRVFFRSGLLSFALNPGTAASLFFSCSNSSGSGWSLTFSSAGKPDLLSSSLTPLGVLYSILNLCLTSFFHWQLSTASESPPGARPVVRCSWLLSSTKLSLSMPLVGADDEDVEEAPLSLIALKILLSLLKSLLRLFPQGSTLDLHLYQLSWYVVRMVVCT